MKCNNCAKPPRFIQPLTSQLFCSNLCHVASTYALICGKRDREEEGEDPITLQPISELDEDQIYRYRYPNGTIASFDIDALWAWMNTQGIRISKNPLTNRQWSDEEIVEISQTVERRLISLQERGLATDNYDEMIRILDILSLPYYEPRTMEARIRIIIQHPRFMAMMAEGQFPPDFFSGIKDYIRESPAFRNYMYSEEESQKVWFYYLARKHPDAIFRQTIVFKPRYINYRNIGMDVIDSTVVYACGHGQYGKLGNGILGYHAVPIPAVIPDLRNIVQVACGSNHTLLLAKNGIVYGCGSAKNGVIGNVGTGDIPTVIENLPLITQIACGQYRSMFLSRDGTVYACGNGTFGSLGDGKIHDHDVEVPTLIPDFDGVIEIACGAHHNMFLKNDGTVYGCGNVDHGRLGIRGHHVGTPTRVPIVQDITQIACGGFNSMFLTEEKIVYICGDGHEGKLGDGDYDDHASWVPIPVPLQQTAQIVACGFMHNMIITENGNVYAFGFNFNGALGLSIYQIATPTRIPNFRNIKQIESKGDFTLFLTHDGTVYSCGSNRAGKMGIGENLEKTTIPTPIPLLEDVKSIACGSEHSMFIL